jgi:hypothetical protein
MIRRDVEGWGIERVLGWLKCMQVVYAGVDEEYMRVATIIYTALLSRLRSAACGCQPHRGA